MIDSLGLGTTTGEDGAYTLKNVPFGTYNLSASIVGYTTVRLKVIAKPGKAVAIDFTLKEDITTLKEVEVASKTKAQQVKETGFNVNSIEVKKFENSNADVNRVLNQSSGIRIRETGGLGSSFNFYLNGLSGKAVKFFIDGQPMEDYGAVFNLNNIPVNMIERVDVYKGAVPVSLGNDALGGAINIITKQSAKTFLDASYSYGSFNTHRAALTGQWRDSKSGLTIKPQFFYNYSDNDYTMYNLRSKKDILSSPTIGNFKRFLNSYESYLGDVQFGFTQKKWADRFFIGVGYGKVNQDVFASRGYKHRNGGYEIIAPDGARQYEKDYRYTLQYAKKDLFVKKLDFNVSAAYNKLNLRTVDTLRDEYNWEGKVVRTNPNYSENRITEFDQTIRQLTSALSYKINDHHTFTTSFNWSHIERQNVEEKQLNIDYNYLDFDIPQKVDKQVLGVAYQNTLFNGRLQTTLSGKYYKFFIPSAAENYEITEWSPITREEVESARNNFGYGVATRFKITEDWLIKASYEKAFRLPEVEEAFGDGMFLLPNLDLLPENSHNFNLGTQHTWQMGDHDKLNVELGGFYRLMQNRIFVSPPAQNAFYTYTNIDGVIVKGVEADLRYSYKNKLTLGANATFQDVRNDVEFLPNTNTPNFVYKDRMYNTPVFFANADASYTIDRLTTKNLQTRFFYNVGYVSAFYLNYSSIARAGGKSLIPTQVVQDLGATLSSADNRYHLTLECRNLLNSRAYDNVAMQKPGRAFYIKVRYFLINQ